jgi:hypothetical protein
LGYISALDSVNPYVSFKQALTSTSRLVSWNTSLLLIIIVSVAFQMQNGPFYQVATTALSVEQQTLLMEVMRQADIPSA